jgi:hypothetical protein
MNWQDIINNSELIYASVPEDKGFRTWSLKKTTCNISFYESFPLDDDIDRIICNILKTNDDCLEEEKIATILGFNVIDNFDITPKRYADKAELEIFRAIVKPVLDWGLVEKISGKEKPILFKLTELGERTIETEEKYKFHTGQKILFENFGIKPQESNDNLFFPFYSELGIFSDIESIRQILYEKITTSEIFDIDETDLIKRHELQSNKQYKICKSDTTNRFEIGSCQVDIRLCKYNNEYYPVIFYNNQACVEATELLHKPENAALKEKKIEWGLYLKLIKDPDAILDYETIFPFEDLLELNSLIKDTRLVWNDKQLFTFIAERANANQWFDISNHCPVDVFKSYLKTYKEKWDWTSLSLRIDDDFLIQNATKYPWNFEAISANEDISIEVVKRLLLIPELKKQEWDWDTIMPQLDFEFIKSNIDKMDFELSELTKTDIHDVQPLITLYPEKRWNWSYISAEYDLSYILNNVLAFSEYLNLKNVINRAFTSEEYVNLFCQSADFIKVISNTKDYKLKDYSPNLSKYIWTEQLIEVLETTGYLTWDSGSYTLGFECNPYIDWAFDFFKQHHSKITTPKGFDFVSAHITDIHIVSEFTDFNWNWDIISANSNLISDSNFLLSIKNKINFNILLSNITGEILETIFVGAEILSFLETNIESWVDVTEKSSKEFVLQHIGYNWDWSILSRRFCSTIKLDALGNPKWIDKWDWKYLTQSLDLSVVTENLDLYLDRWDWEYLSKKLDKEFVLSNIPKYNDYWDWNILLNDRLEKQDLLLTSHLTEIADCISVCDHEQNQRLWQIITRKFDYADLEDLIEQTYNQDVFYWDYAYFYDLPAFSIRNYLQNHANSINWKELSGCKKLEETFRYDEKLFNEKVWRKDVIQQLDRYGWNFYELSKIGSINSDYGILNQYKGKWDWNYLSLYSRYFSGINKDKRKIESFQQYINFALLSQRENVGLTDKIISDYIEKQWDWSALSENKSVRVSFKFIKEHKDKPWDWQALSERNDIKFDNKTIIELSDYNWDWVSISNRTDIEYDEELITKLHKKLLDWEIVSQNKTFVPNAKTLSLLKGKVLDWNAISQSDNLSKEILWDYRDNLKWKYLTTNEKVIEISNAELLKKYKDYLDWSFISKSEKFEVSFDNLKYFKDKLIWRTINNRLIDEEEHYAITEYMLEPFADVLDWSKISQSMKIHFTEELIEKYRNKWDWQLLRKNSQIIERLETTLKKYQAEFNCVDFLEQFDRTPYIYHFTHLFNATQIIKERKIKSRNNARGHFYNCAGTIADKNPKAHNFARFYYRPLTPNQLYNECLGHDSESCYLKTWRYWDGKWIHCKKWKTYYPQARSLGLPKCPIPVFFKFDLKEVLQKMKDKCFYSNGCMQTNRAKAFKITVDPNRLTMDKLFSKIEDFEFGESGRYKDIVQQEFLVEEEFDFSNLDSFEIICYNDEYVNLLKSQLGDDSICGKINAIGSDVFHRGNRELVINETDTEVSIFSEYEDSAYLSIKGEGLKNIQILNPDEIQRETATEIIAYPRISFIKAEQPIEVHFVDTTIGMRDWLVYANSPILKNTQNTNPQLEISSEILDGFLDLQNHLHLKLSKELFYPNMVNSFHGIAHTIRVLFGSYLILVFSKQNFPNEIKKAIYYAAIMHDLGKTNDREGSEHGAKSAELYKEKIKDYLTPYFQLVVLKAIKYHSIEDDLCPTDVKTNFIWKILKDADTLDRGRFHSKCDKSYLRLDIFKTEVGDILINFMDKLSYYTQNLEWNNPYSELINCIKTNQIQKLCHI